MILGITGTLGAGKGTAVEYLKEKGFVHYSGSGMLREILESRGEEVNREAYSRLANELREQDKEGLMKLVYARVQNEGKVNVIIEALHDVGEGEFIKRIGGFIIGIDAPLDIRFERISKRKSEKDNVDFEAFKKIAAYEEEGGGKHNIRAVLKMADFTIMNNVSLANLHEQVDVILAQIGH